MTHKERIIKAIKGEKLDRIPCVPDTSFNFPIRYVGLKPIDFDLGLRDHLREAYIPCARHFNYPVWAYTRGNLVEREFDLRGLLIGEKFDLPMKHRVTKIKDGLISIEQTIETQYGKLQRELGLRENAPVHFQKYFIIEDFEKEYRKILELFVNPWHKDFTDINKAIEDIGEDGVLLKDMNTPVDFWFTIFGAERGVNYIYDYPEIFDEIVEKYVDWNLETIKAAAKKTTLEIIGIGGSYSSMSVSSPTLFKKYDLPYIKKAAQLIHQLNLLAQVHICGRSNELIDDLVEAEVDCIEPLEPFSSGGNVNLKEIKEKYGDKVCLKGNIDPVNILQNGTAKQVEEEVKKCLEIGMKGGRFILASADQVTRDTPYENIEAMVNTTQKYGVF